MYATHRYQQFKHLLKTFQTVPVAMAHCDICLKLCSIYIYLPTVPTYLLTESYKSEVIQAFFTVFMGLRPRSRPPDGKPL